MGEATDLNSVRNDFMRQLMEKDYLLSEDFVSYLKDIPEVGELVSVRDRISSYLNAPTSKGILVLNRDLIDLMLKKTHVDLNWIDFEKSKVLQEKEKDPSLYNKFVQVAEVLPVSTKSDESGSKQIPKDIEIIASYEAEGDKLSLKCFLDYLRMRFKKMESILTSRRELQSGLVSISKIITRKERDNLATIGMINSIRETKNGNIILEVEDLSGAIKVLISKNKPDLFNLGKQLVLDEIIGITGINGDNIIFSDNIYLPDIPLSKELKKSDREQYAIFLSDIHVGSKNFLEAEFSRFLKWIRGELGDEKQKETAKRVKYVFVTGDLVDGVGVYPNQDLELTIKDIIGQYQECAKFLKQIPKDKTIIICPGNHDAIRLAEPQPVLFKDFAKDIWEMENTILVSNPSIVRIGISERFPGFDVLMYHGFSFTFFADCVDFIRSNGGLERPDLIMKFLLQRRHLAPTHKSTVFVPHKKFDPLVIDPIPDFFVSGHIHKAAIASYRNVTTVCGSCWQSKTSFEEKMGLNPEPARVPLINLATREGKILRF